MTNSATSPFSQLPTHPINKQNDTYYHLENTEYLCQRTVHSLAQQSWSRIQRLNKLGPIEASFFSATQLGKDNI